jgi:hypothetical protein
MNWQGLFNSLLIGVVLLLLVYIPFSILRPKMAAWAFYSLLILLSGIAYLLILFIPFDTIMRSPSVN